MPVTNGGYRYAEKYVQLWELQSQYGKPAFVTQGYGAQERHSVTHPPKPAMKDSPL